MLNVRKQFRKFLRGNMLFATNRMPNEGENTAIGRNVSFDPQNITASQHMFFCERKSQDEYIEIGNDSFFTKLSKDRDCKQILLFIHGFNNRMEDGAFQKAISLQQLLDRNIDLSNGYVRVIPLIWPCDDDGTHAMLDDYYDDRITANISAEAFARMLGKFGTWHHKQKEKCYKRINVLAHSMGNRVLRGALNYWTNGLSSSKQMPQLFRNIFMVAADVVNDTLEKREKGQYIPQAARNVVVYYANDDFAMPASKIANIFRSGLSRRLGMTGPEDMNKVPKNVYAVDCDDFNNTFDKPAGHTYFLSKNEDLSRPSPIIQHIATALETGRVDPPDRHHQLLL